MTQTIGILGTGDMGSAVGRMLRQSGYRVVTALEGRSPLSRELAVGAGLDDLGSLEAVLAESGLFLSILPPSAARAFAERAATIIAAEQHEIVYADCNAVAPATLTAISKLFAAGPARFVDVGIVGPPPGPGRADPTRFYVSGADRRELLGLAVDGIRLVDMGEQLGRASAIKMCYAAMNKGVDALYANLLLAGRRLGVYEALWRELERSQPEAAARMAKRIPFLAATAGRYTGEMAEIAATFDAAGVSGDFYRGAEFLYAQLARSSLAAESRASLPAERSLEEALEAFMTALER